ncbi:J domain-containing protein [Bythopirellula goksoeyrii]|uniref:Chaperone protein DnaJ n=1 Tax=Bythopirellula goksoeyrii TaxID=1400387 RepID=A0A5B9Q6H1_9BACT|nr:J domain-containing protein [Bythopirellula goksoeyrii]QEG33290.1 chaperone protein DnaJ [Bythopirellula goksoeyrii]
MHKAIKESLEILHLGPSASPEDIEQAYRDLAKLWHPDKSANDPLIREQSENRIKAINRAYEILRQYGASSRKNIGSLTENTIIPHGPKRPRQTSDAKDSASPNSSEPFLGDPGRSLSSNTDMPFRFIISVSVLGIGVTALVLWSLYRDEISVAWKSSAADYLLFIASAISILLLLLMHRMSLGRTSPIAAAAFVICGPLIGTFVVIAYAISEVLEVKRGMFVAADDEIHLLVLRFVCAGFIGAAIAAAIAANDKRDEWFNHL